MEKVSALHEKISSPIIRKPPAIIEDTRRQALIGLRKPGCAADFD
jgi:hypothetical protein